MRMSKIVFGAATAAVLVIPSALFAQIPTITSAANYATLDARFSPGALVSVLYQPENSYDGWNDFVQVGGERVPALSGDERSLVFQLPFDLPLGPTTLTITTRAGSSPPFTINLEPYAPGLVYPLTRSQTPGWISPFSCLPGQTATPGEIITAFAVGLGATDPVVPAGQPAPMTPSSTVAEPGITVGGKPAQVVESVLAPGQIGLYRVRFVVPPGEGWHLVALAIGGQRSNLAALPVGEAMLSVPSTTFRAGPAAPESIATAYRCGSSPLANTGRPGFSADPPNLPTALGDTSIKVRDSAGDERLAPLYYVGTDQVNYMIPQGTASGIARVTAISGDRVVYEADVEIQAVAPGFFFGATQLVRVRNGAKTVEPVSQGTVDMGPDSDQVYLVLYGTGLRFRSSLASVIARITGGEQVQVEYAGPQGSHPGLDQVNVKLPRSLAGRGDAYLEVIVDGISANWVYLNFK